MDFLQGQIFFLIAIGEYQNHLLGTETVALLSTIGRFRPITGLDFMIRL